MEEHQAEYDREEIPRPGLSFSPPAEGISFHWLVFC